MMEACRFTYLVHRLCSFANTSSSHCDFQSFWYVRFPSLRVYDTIVADTGHHCGGHSSPSATLCSGHYAESGKCIHRLLFKGKSDCEVRMQRTTELDRKHIYLLKCFWMDLIIFQVTPCPNTPVCHAVCDMHTGVLIFWFLYSNQEV